MMLAISLIGLNVVLEAWPLWVVLLARLGQRSLTQAELAGVVASFTAVAVIDLAVFALAAARGIRALESLQR
jgi:hypothetical protein